MDTVLKDLGYALRGLRKNLGFAVVATVTIALGIASCTAIFSVVNAVLLRPLPYADAQRLVIVWGELRARNVRDWPFSPPDFRDLKMQSTATFEDMAAVLGAGRVPIAQNGGEPEQVRAAAATPNVFKLLGARILVGRDFTDEDAQPPPSPPPAAAASARPQAPPPRLPNIAILSHGLWMRRFGGDPAIVGTDIDFGGGRAHIVGVLAPEFELLFPPRANIERLPDLWTVARINYETANRNNVSMRVIARVEPGVTLDQAQAQADRVSAELRRQFPIKTTAGLHFRVVPMYEDLVSGVRPAILSLMGAVAFVLLIACANVANLLVVRASARSRELAIRAAIGGSRLRLVRQMLAESLVIAAIGTAAGVLLAQGGLRRLLALAPKDLPRLHAVSIDPIVLTFAIVAGLATAVICGVAPALRASRADVMEVLRAVGRSAGLRGGRRLRHGMVIAEVALSFVLLIGAGLMLRSFVALGRVQPGYDANHVLTFFLPVQIPQAPARQAFMQQARQRLLAIPGVEAVTAANPLPLDGGTASGRWGTEAARSDPSAYRQATFHMVLPGYFEAMRTRLLAGRTFTDADNHVDLEKQTPKQIVIDELVARRAFANPQAAIGQRLLARINTPDAELFEVIGVVEHQRHVSLATEGPEAIFFVDGYLGHGAAARWAVRTAGDPNLVATAVRAAIKEIHPRAAPAEVQPMQAFVDKAMAPVTFTASLIGIFAAVAVVLAAVGLYGVLSTIVRQRTAEIGMRMVFGAQRSSILRLVVGEGLRLSIAGVVIGVAAALGITRLMASMLVGVSPMDPPTFAGIVVLFVTIALGATWLPARRAARLDPIAAIRDE